MADEAPKSAYELAMERLRRKDKEEGVDDRPPTPEQREAIAEARRVAEAKLAEREILHHSAVKGVMDPESREKLDEEYRRDRDRIASEREGKIARIRAGQG
ncbi:MAG TPA: hypothetical protein VMT87_11895 [Vicinamibacteria bacterium]|nr:hypothetical protein [Vicinamibacteria bacterium]